MEAESNIYTKQSRGRSTRYQEQEPEDAATHIVLAATKTSEQHWLMNLSGWAPDTNEQYQTWEHSDSSMEAESDSWEWIDSKELAVTATQDTISAEYKEFQHLFNQPEQPELPTHGLHDHTIPLEEGKNPACKKIYSISEKESHMLQEYIDKQLKKGTIRASKSPAGHRVLFVPKKDGSL